MQFLKITYASHLIKVNYKTLCWSDIQLIPKRLYHIQLVHSLKKVYHRHGCQELTQVNVPAISWPWSGVCQWSGSCRGSWSAGYGPVPPQPAGGTCGMPLHRSEDQQGTPRRHAPSGHQRQSLKSIQISLHPSWKLLSILFFFIIQRRPLNLITDKVIIRFIMI